MLYEFDPLWADVRPGTLKEEEYQKQKKERTRSYTIAN